MAQVLPSDESFEAPDWATGILTSVITSQTWYWWYMGLDPSVAINATTHSTYPLRDGGELEVVWASDLYIPRSAFPVGLPAIMTDKLSGDPLMQRGIISRGNLGTEQDNTSYKVSFGLQEVGGTTTGASQGGRSGSGPGPAGAIEYPTPSGITGNDHTTAGSGSGGNFTPGGGTRHAISPYLWAAWNGNALFFRCGGGLATPTGASSNGTGRNWGYWGVDCYSFLAYPVINGADVDLYLELWQTKFVDNLVNYPNNIPRLLIRQVVNDGVPQIAFKREYHFRVTVDTNGSDVDLTAFLGGYIDPTTGVVSDEVQCFKDGVFANNTYSVGTNVAHTSSTGLVKDQHADKITAFANKTIGWSMGPERTQDVSSRTGASGTTNISVQEGVYSVELADASSDVVIYRDEFKRVAFDMGESFAGTLLAGLFGTIGHKCLGMFTCDGYSDDYSAGNGEIERLLTWAAAPATGSGVLQDYVQLWTDPSIVKDLTPSDVMRLFIYERPSTQFYNHHRSVTFKVGDATGAVGSPATLSFEFGIVLRGSATGRKVAATVCYIAWTVTVSTNALTSWSIRIAERTADYFMTNPAGSLLTEQVIASKTYTSSFPTFNNSAFHTLDFRAEVYPGATNPKSAAIYHVEYDGSPVELDDTAPSYQSSTITPYPVTHPNPTYYAGKAEGFWFLSDSPQYASGPLAVWNPMQVKNWTEGALTADPGSGEDPNEQASIAVSGEGTAVGSLNATSGALGISGGGVWNVETKVDVEFFYPSRRVDFASGHTYTGPAASKPRRRWRVTVQAADLAVYQSLQTFYNSHNGPEIPFSFIVPIPDDGTATGSTAEATETVVGWFNEDALLVNEIGPQVYSISFSVVELLVT